MMSSSIVAEPTLHPTTTQMQVDAKEFLRNGRFYWTNAGFPKELDRSKSKYTKSPLRSFRPLPPSRPLERELLRECRDTSFNFKTIGGRQLRGRKKINKRRPCYLASYDKSSNEGVIFLGTTTAPDNVQRFVIVQCRSPMDLLQFGSLGTKPPNSFGEKGKKTYFNISHPLRVQFAYLLNSSLFPRTKEDGNCYDGHEPPLVSIANFATQSSDVAIISNAGLETSIVFDEESEQLFWRKHKEYHRQRPGQYGPDDDSGRVGPDDDSGGAGLDDDSGRAGLDDDSGGVGPDDDSRKAGPGNDSGGAGVGDGCSSSGGTGPNAGGGGSSKGGFSSCKVEDAPWGRVGDQRIGIDIPLVIEDTCSDEDEEMDLEDLVINSDANDVPWGRIGDQRIGIDIPLVTEDIYSDPDEEMDSKSDEELHEVDNDPNKPESSDQKGITTWPNPSDEESSRSYTIAKPYFVISMALESRFALLDYNYSAGKWRWTQKASKKYHIVISIEGLSYEYPISGQIDSIRRIFNWHTKKYIELPPFPDGTFPIVGMIVDTSVQPYAFKVIECSDKSTMIYDSPTHSWTHRQVQPPFCKCRFDGSANVASCKGIVFILDNYDRIVIYDTEKDKWDHVRHPKYWSDLEVPRKYMSGEKLCGIGSWDDRVFLSIYEEILYVFTFEIWELVDFAKPEWKKFDAIPTKMYSWLKNEAEDNCNLRIDVSYCNENLLIWAWINSSAKRFVLYNLARKTWEKLELPLLTLTDLEMVKFEYEYQYGVNVDDTGRNKGGFSFDME